MTDVLPHSAQVPRQSDEFPAWNELLAGYVPAGEGYNEMLAPLPSGTTPTEGNPNGQGLLFARAARPHWQRFLEAMSQFQGERMSRRWTQARQLIRENGVTYNVYGDPQGLDRTWQLDPIPFILPPEEWRQIETGLIQRATLINQILIDVYGPGDLLRTGTLPAGVVYGHPHFLRPCVGLRVPQDTYVQLYAADLARRPDGSWCVLNDRTQAPSGVGYALENRLVLSRMMPEVLHAVEVERLARFATELRESLEQLAPPASNESPRIVLLTPGPYNETYFEHAYLARFLGCTLAEGADLTVRDNRVYLKTLSGLLQVDVILRRLDEDYCDPLELRSDSALGIPGLLQAVAAGQVTVANAIGCGLAESPALHPFLPVLARELLGEDLLLPTVPTWWCGQAQERNFVRQHLSELSIQPVFGTRRFQLFSDPTADPEALRGELELHGSTYTGHERFPLATTPTLKEGTLEARPHVLRCFLIAHQGGYTMMPGGLTRVASSPDQTNISMQRGAGSKDTWFLSDGPPTGPTLVKMEPPGFAIQRSGGDLPSRVADNLFWLGRYTDRLESVVRLFRTVLQRLADESALRHMPGLAHLLSIPTQLGLLKPVRGGFDPADPETFFKLEGELLNAVFERRRPGSLGETLSRLHHAASSVRDRISPDLWRILNHLHNEVHLPEKQADLTVGESLALLDQMVLTLSAFSGMEMENMIRGHDWRFIELGRRLERAMNLTNLLQLSLVQRQPNEDAILEALLQIADSSMTYRTRYFAAARPKGVLDLLVTDETNPRSLAFQISEIAAHTEKLPAYATDASVATNSRSYEEKLVIEALSRLQVAEVDSLAAVLEPENRRPQLEDLLDWLSDTLPQISDQLTQHYFNHV